MPVLLMFLVLFVLLVTLLLLLLKLPSFFPFGVFRPCFFALFEATLMITVTGETTLLLVIELADRSPDRAIVILLSDLSTFLALVFLVHSEYLLLLLDLLKNLPLGFLSSPL